MLREVGNLYSRSFRLIFQHPLFWILSLVNYLYGIGSASITVWVKGLQSLGLITTWNLVNLIVDVIFHVGIPLVFILMVFQIEDGIAPSGIFQSARKFFWGFFRQELVGLLLTLLYSFPFACLALYAVSLESSPFYLAVFPLWFFVSGFIGFGAVALGQRILLDGGDGAFMNAAQGMRMLNGNFRFFFALYFVLFLIGVGYTVLRYGVGSAIAGVDLLSVQIFPLTEFWSLLISTTKTPIIQLIDFIYGVIFFALNAIVPTLAYLHIKNQPIPIPPIRRKPITEN